MTSEIDWYTPKTGRTYGEGSRVVNIADLVEWRTQAIQEGRTFYVFANITIEPGATILFQMNVPSDKNIWLDPIFYSFREGLIRITIIEDPQIATQGIEPLTVLNCNRNSNRISSLSVMAGTDGVSGGVIINDMNLDFIGNFGGAGGIIPKKGSVLVGAINNFGTTAAIMHVKLTWIEFDL